MDMTIDTLIKNLIHARQFVSTSNLELGYKLTHEKSKLGLFLSRCLAFNLTNYKDEGVWATASRIPKGPDMRIIVEAVFAHLRPQTNYPDRANYAIQSDPRKTSHAIIISTVRMRHALTRLCNLITVHSLNQEMGGETTSFEAQN